ncbi:hypothetical protein [Microbulbifer sp. Q7]|uniref:hypothetical protein n=1 Tax=Microbulbifer sp. Q7 TaxID=1785091 RepID=UPI000832B8A6|nr:hypothetical protein [Microbulbifer sp. Q7]
MRDGRSALAPLLLLSALLVQPSCGLIPSEQPLVGFPPNTAQQVRQNASELAYLRGQPAHTPAQQKQIAQLSSRLQQFERDVILTARSLEQQNHWRDAQQALDSAIHLLPDSLALHRARQQQVERRQHQEERVRTELEIHKGEQLLKDTVAYQHLRQLKEPGVLNWLELKNFNRKRRASAESLQEHAQRALEREDYALAQRALKVAQGLYGEDLPLASEEREKITRDLALTSQKLRPAKPRPANRPRKKVEKLPVAELEQSLDAGDLVSARQHLDALEQRSPQPPQLRSLKLEFQAQLASRVTTALQRGNELYSQGEIQRALDIWREAGALAPDNLDLQASIARAEKLLENLKALSAPQGAER